MLVQLSSGALLGVDAYPIHIEVDVAKGAQYFMVGLPDNAVRESWKRMETAIRAVGARMPRQRIVINLAPADQRKQGAGFDLPMAVGILAASGQVPAEALAGYWFIGELALDGRLRPVPGALSVAVAAREHGAQALVVPRANAREAALADGLSVLAADDLGQVMAHLQGKTKLDRILPETAVETADRGIPDFGDVQGQASTKRALEVAAAGGHHCLLIGPPGAGKTMLARRFPGILPPPTREEALDITRVHSAAGAWPPGAGLAAERPFRAPHHTCSDVALVGGGSPPSPGEATMAHCGVFVHFYTKTITASYPTPNDYPHDPKTLGEHLKKVRYDRRISQRAAARKIGIADETYREWELDIHFPNTSLMPKVFDFLGYCLLPGLTLGKRLQAYRYANGLLIGKAAKLMQSDRGVIRKIEEGHTYFGLYEILVNALLEGRLPLEPIQSSERLEKPLGYHLCRFRQQTGITKRALARKLGVWRNTVTSWEDGSSQPKLHHWPRILEVLGYNPLVLDSGPLSHRLKRYRMTHGLTHEDFSKKYGICAWLLRHTERELSVRRKSYSLALELIVRSLVAYKV